MPWSPHFIICFHYSSQRDLCNRRIKACHSTDQNHRTAPHSPGRGSTGLPASPTSGPHSLPLTPSDVSPLLSLLLPHRPLCFLSSIPDIFPPQGFCSGCSCCLERLLPRSHPFKSVLKRYPSEAYQTIPLKMAKLSSCTLLAPSLLCFPRHLCKICYGCIPPAYNGNWHTVNVWWGVLRNIYNHLAFHGHKIARDQVVSSYLFMPNLPSGKSLWVDNSTLVSSQPRGPIPAFEFCPCHRELPNL